MAKVHREVVDPGPPPGTVPFTESDYDAYLTEFLERRPPGPLYVFSYGSLIWKPAFAPVTSAHAVAHGWQRSFCLKVLRFRGSPELPGLMMQIDRGGTCEGLLCEVAEARAWSDLSGLLRREMSARPPSNLPRWIEVESGGRALRAIAFTANPESPYYAGEQDFETVARLVSTGCGQWGSCAEYVMQTVMALEKAGIHDPYLWALQERVAELIDELNGDSAQLS